MRILFLWLLLLVNLQSWGKNGWVISAGACSDYFGVTLSNGNIGLVAGEEICTIKEINLSGVFDKVSAKGINKMVQAPVFANLEIIVDGVMLKRQNVKSLKQHFLLKQAILETTFSYQGVNFKHSFMALGNLPYTGLVTLKVESEKDVDIQIRNKYAIPASIQEIQHAFKDGRRILVSQVSGKTSMRKHTVSSSSLFVFDEQKEVPVVFPLKVDGANKCYGMEFSKKMKAGDCFNFALVGSSCSTADFVDPINASKRFAVFAAKSGIDLLKKNHLQHWAHLWESDIIIEGDDETQLDVRLALYNLYSSVNPIKATSIGPMGLTEVDEYNGHCFWDTEIWMYPPLLALNQHLASKIIEFRFNTLQQARNNALNNGYRGAMYPWEADGYGEESTPVWALTGPFEHHISADISISIWNYWCVTKNLDWLRTVGYPIMKEIAEFYVSRVTLNADGTYSINNVVGADEYAENVNDNAFTNGAVKISFESTIKAAEILNERAPQIWSNIASKIRFHYDTDGVMMEYDGYQGEIIKQADVNMLSYPLNIRNSAEDIKKDIDYYLPKMDPNGPAMSKIIIATILARQQKATEAFKMFKQSYEPNVRSPFRVLAECANTQNPYFVTAAGGMLQAVIFGFGGLQFTEEGIIQQNPCLPKHWKSLTLKGIGPDKKTYVIK